MPSESNWLLLLSYDGTNYNGWQIQPNQPTIEGTLEEALRQLTGKTIKVHGSGRTDSGVHGLNQTATFSISSSSFGPEKWRIALNGVLPDDLVVKHVQQVPGSFHARHSAIGKRYRYLVCNLPYHSPFSRNKGWWVRKPLDLEAIRLASTYLLGRHDFTAFRASGCTSPNPVKEIREVSCHIKKWHHANVCFEIEADSFLQHMVRIIVGTLVEVGLGKLKSHEMKEILEGRDRSQAGPTAPAHGLYSLAVHYPKGTVSWPEEVINR